MAASLDSKEMDELKKELEYYKKQATHLFESETELGGKMNKLQAKIEYDAKKHAEEVKLLKQRLQESDNEIKKLKQQHASSGVKKNSKGKLIEKTESVDDKTVTEHQLRAYKRQVDELRQTVESKREEYESKSEEYESKIQRLEMKAFESNSHIEKERAVLKKLHREYEHMKQKQSQLEQDLLHYKTLYDHRTEENARLKNQLDMINPVISNSYLPRVISEGCGVVQGIPPYEHQYNNNTDHIHLEEEYSRRSVDESTRKADEALKELEITRNQSNISAPVTHYNGPVAVISQQTSHRVYSDGQVAYNDDHMNDVTPSIPYDPNLVCPHCNKQFRYGEIQNLRLHINNECTHRYS